MALIRFKSNHIFRKDIKLLKNILDLFHDFFLFMFRVFYIAKSLLFKITLEKQGLNIFELQKKLLKFLVVIVFDGAYLITHRGQLVNLSFNLIMELADFVFQVFNLEVIEHHHIVTTMVS